MLMPGRSGYTVTGGWATSSGGSTSSTSPATLSISSRYGNAPSEYVASESVEFTPGFESGVNDAFDAYLGSVTTSGGSGGSSSSYASGGYRYGFNGKENDNEVKGEGSQQDYGMRIYDPRVGRFLSVDPLISSYPWYTPYQFAGNMPVNSIDLDGLEPTEAVKGSVGQGPASQGAKLGGGFAYKFAKGVIKTAAITLGAFTELFASAHYGEQVKNKEEAFPLTYGNPIYAAKQAIVAPVDLILRLKKDPTNPEILGEAAAFLGILKFNLGAKGGAPDIALGLNEPVPMGPPRSLIRFADQTSSYMHYDWEKPFGSIASTRTTDVSFGDIFTRVMDHVVNNKGTVKFDLTKFDMNRAASDFGKNALDASSMTNYELNTIMGNTKYLKATEFYRNGERVKTSQIVKEYNEALKKQKN